jgi:tetratricopeptide (TPR) repeat protein
MRLIEAKRMSGDLMVADAVTGFAELWLVEAAGLTGTSRRTALRRGDRACAAALRLSRKAAGCRPEAIRLHGTLAWMCGSRRRAITRWQRSIAAAETLGMPVERARTLLEMGDRLGDVALVDEARAAFQSTGAKVDLAFALHVLARMAAVSDSNAVTALALYDQAIAGLSEVKAESRLGLAYQERARLLEEAGRHEEARSDLARARHSFEVVSADAEKTQAA